MSAEVTDTSVVTMPTQTGTKANRAAVRDHHHPFLIGLWAVMVIFPFLWMIMTSFKTDPEILFSPWKLPESIQWDNYSRAWNKAHIGRYFLNTLIVISGRLPERSCSHRWRRMCCPIPVSRVELYFLPLRGRHDVSGFPGLGSALLPGARPAHDPAPIKG